MRGLGVDEDLTVVADGPQCLLPNSSDLLSKRENPTSLALARSQTAYELAVYNHVPGVALVQPLTRGLHVSQKLRKVLVFELFVCRLELDDDKSSEAYASEEEDEVGSVVVLVRRGVKTDLEFLRQQIEQSVDGLVRGQDLRVHWVDEPRALLKKVLQDLLVVALLEVDVLDNLLQGLDAV